MFEIRPAAMVIIVAGGVAAVALLLRRFNRSRRGNRSVVGALGIAVLLALLSLATDASGVATLPLGLRVGATVSLLIGIGRVAGFVLFDIVLARAGMELPSIVRVVMQVVIVSVLTLGCLRLAGIDLLPLLTTSAVLTAVIGISLQSTLANLFAGLALQLDRTLRGGDWIQVHGHTGRIEEIGWRSTRLVTKDGDTVFVPNGSLVSGEVLNYSHPTSQHRMWVRVGFHFRHPPNRVRRMLVDAVVGVRGVLEDPPPDCLVTEFGESAVQYAVRYWIDDFEHDVVIDSEVRARIWYAARRSGLEMPYPIRTLVGPPTELPEPTWGDARGPEGLLARTDLFAPLADDCRHQLATGMRRVDFGAGETIIRQGDRGDSLFLIQTGEVHVLLEVEGASAGVAVSGPGKFFGEMSLMTGDPRSATCVAQTDVTCWVLDAAVLRPVLVAQPAIAEKLSEILVERQMELAAEHDDLSAAVRATAREQHQRLAGRVRHFFGLD